MYKFIEGGTVNPHPFGYFLRDLRNSFSSSLKNMIRVETKVMAISTIVDSLSVISYPTPNDQLSIDNKKVQSKRLDFISHLRLENNLSNLYRDNHFSYKIIV